MAAVENEGWGAPSAWADILTDIEANKAAQQLYGKLVGKVVEDADTVKSLTPLYPIGCKRPCIDTGYYETYNLPHVKLVDLKKGAIKRVTEQGIETEQGAFAFDVIVYATGFDAVTGALNRIDIRGKGGEKLRERWETEGPRTYLGLQARGFPNLFTITGPLSPAVLANMILAVEQHMDWIGDLLVHMRAKGLSTVEPEEDAVDAWVEHNASVSEGTVATDPSCNSWYVGANVPGKARIYMNYRGGFPVYREKCAEIAARGYEGFAIA
jgi:cation diffusion facilitator CzcD-associated flavoprotein CzcO